MEEKTQGCWDTFKARFSTNLIGILVIMGIITSWIGSAEFANYAERYTKYSQPFFIVYFNNCWNMIIWPIFFSWRLCVDFFRD